MKEKIKLNNEKETPSSRRKFIKSLGVLGVACTSLSYIQEASAMEVQETEALGNKTKTLDMDFNGYFPWVGP